MMKKISLHLQISKNKKKSKHLLEKGFHLRIISKQVQHFVFFADLRSVKTEKVHGEVDKRVDNPSYDQYIFPPILGISEVDHDDEAIYYLFFLCF